jgi:hypothetical protein
MTVDAGVTRQILQEELGAMEPIASSYGWDVTTNLEALTVTVTMRSVIDKEIYIVEACCDGYRAIPPYFEFIYPNSVERGTHRCYPADDSYFHSTPCICVQWNRKAYKTEGGPHQDWQISDWMAARPGTIALGDMFHLIQVRINKRGAYKGRMKQ